MARRWFLELGRTPIVMAILVPVLIMAYPFAMLCHQMQEEWRSMDDCESKAVAVLVFAYTWFVTLLGTLSIFWLAGWGISHLIQAGLLLL